MCKDESPWKQRRHIIFYWRHGQLQEAPSSGGVAARQLGLRWTAFRSERLQVDDLGRVADVVGRAVVAPAEILADVNARPRLEVDDVSFRGSRSRQICGTASNSHMMTGSGSRSRDKRTTLSVS